MSGVRVAKSLLSAANAIRWSQVCDVSRLGPGEVPRVACIAYSVDTAKPLYQHIIGHLQSAPALKPLLRKITNEGAVVAHPSGRDVEISIVAGARAGATLVARWLAGVIFDEWPRMLGEEDGVVNYEESKRAVQGRILDGTQIMSIGSPWAPRGPAYNMVKENWGKPTQQLVLLKAPAWDMNPVWWTEKRVSEFREHMPDAYITDCLGEFLNPEESLFTDFEVSGACRLDGSTLPYNEGQTYRAAMDPATRGNAWTLVVATRRGGMKEIAGAWEWRGSVLKPLSPKLVMTEIAQILRAYRLDTVTTDQYYVDANADHARDNNIKLSQVDLPDKEKTERYLNLKTQLAERAVSIPNLPNLKADLLAVKKKPTQKGLTINLPKTSDKRHCDFAPSIVLSLGDWIKDYKAPLPDRGTEEFNKLQAFNMKQERFTEVKRRLENEKKWKKYGRL